MQDDTPRIPEDRVPGILARAAEIDRAARDTVRMEDIHAAALDAGIDAAAVELALAEYVAGARVEIATARDEDRPGWFRRAWRALTGRMRRPLKHGLAAFAIALIAGLVGAGGEPLIFAAILGWIIWAGRAALRTRPSGRAASYVLSTFAITIGAFIGFGMAEGDEDVWMSILVIGMTVVTLGSAVIKVRFRLPRSWRERRLRAGELTPTEAGDA